MIENTIKLIEKTRGETIDLETLDYGRKEVFELIASGNTDGVFQLESDGMKVFMQELRPDCLEDIIAGISIYRPGPMSQRHSYIHNKKHPEDIRYKHPLLEEILNVTYGFMVYQEQVLQIVRSLAGYSLGKADSMRRVISKKKAAQMEIERHNFIYGLDDADGNVTIEGCIRRGISEETAISIFDEISDFANYAFNKSHAAAYAFVAYQTAYLKTFYPCEFMASLISSIGDQDKINGYVKNCSQMGIDRLPPDINESIDTFSVTDGAIRFGLSAVKNVGRSMILELVSEREKNGKFKNFSDFLERMAGESLNKRALESLIMCGAFDSMGVRRSQLLQVYEAALDGISHSKRSNLAGQMTLFDLGGEEESFDITYPDVAEFDKAALLAMEKEMTGLYFSGHPIDEYEDKIKGITSDNVFKLITSSEQDENGEYRAVIGGISDGDKMIICAVISTLKVKTTKNGSQMAFLEIEDSSGAAEAIVYPRVYEQFRRAIFEQSVVMLRGTASVRTDEKPKLVVNDVTPLDKVEVKKRYKVYIRLENNSSEELKSLLENITKFRGTAPVILYFANEKRYAAAPEEYSVLPSDGAIAALRNIYGEDNVIVKNT